MTDKYKFRAVLFLAIGVLSLFALFLLVLEWRLLVLIYGRWYAAMLFFSIVWICDGLILFGVYGEKAVTASSKEQGESHE